MEKHQARQHCVQQEAFEEETDAARSLAPHIATGLGGAGRIHDLAQSAQLDVGESRRHDRALSARRVGAHHIHRSR